MEETSLGFSGPHDNESAAMASIRTALSRASLRQPSVQQAFTESYELSHQYWCSSCLAYDDIIQDGFYELFGEFPDVAPHPDAFPTLESLTSVSSVTGCRRAAILFDRRLDPGLGNIVAQARQAVENAHISAFGSNIAPHRALAQLVAGHLGGPLAQAANTDRWLELAQLQTTGVIFQISTMYLGGPRHRATLYKFLADQIGLPARIVKGRFYADGEDDACVIIPLNGNDMHLDLMSKPGTTYALENRLALRSGAIDSANCALACEGGDPLEASSSSNAVPYDGAEALPSTPAFGAGLLPLLSSKGILQRTDSSHNSNQQQENVAAWVALSKSQQGGANSGRMSVEEVTQVAATVALGGPMSAVHVDPEAHSNPVMVSTSPPMLRVGKTSDAYPTFPASHHLSGQDSIDPITGEIAKRHDSMNPASTRSGDSLSSLLMTEVRLSIGPDTAPEMMMEAGPPALVRDSSGQQYIMQPIRNSREYNAEFNSFTGSGRMSAADRLRSTSTTTLGPEAPGRNGSGVESTLVSNDGTPQPASPSRLITSFRGGNEHIEAMLQWAAMHAAGASGSAPAVVGLSPKSRVQEQGQPSLDSPLRYGRGGGPKQAQQGYENSNDFGRMYIDGLVNNGLVRMSVPVEFEQRQALLRRKSEQRDEGSSPPLADARTGSRSSGGGVPFPQPEFPRGDTIFSPFSAIQRPLTASTTDPGSLSPSTSLHDTPSGPGHLGDLHLEDDSFMERRRPSSAVSPGPRRKQRGGDWALSGDVRNHSMMSQGVSLGSALDDRNEEWEIDPVELQFGPRIGVGSYGEVFRGQWRQTEVAIKRFLDQDLLATTVNAFKKEVAIMERLRHPNIVQFLGASTNPSNLLMITEYVPRGSLFKLLHRTPEFNPDERRRIQMALDVARGMHYLHTCKPPIIHRDLKSPNLLVDKDMSVKVCDFGLSRVRHATILSAKSQAGTPEWTAPEVLQSQPCSESSDVYSFAVILWELLTGEQPWADKTAMQVVGAVGFSGERLSIPENAKPELRELLIQCFGLPQERPTFSEIITVLKKQVTLTAAGGQR